MKELAPIVLFVYNRPWHTEQTLESLSRNTLADKSKLYIVADGPKENATEEQLQNIKEVRDLIKERKWCGEVEIIEREKNLGLANSVITGVTEIVNKYGNIIVLEDDLVTSVGFLKYMNEALDFYENFNEVMGISGYVFPIDKKLPQTFFIKGGSNTWGWATWKRAWNNFNDSSEDLIQKIASTNQIDEFNMEGAYDYFSLLKANNKGNVSSWGVNWYASVFLKGGLGLWPGKSLVQNIGHDGSGSHCSNTNYYYTKKLPQEIVCTKIPIVESKKGRKAIIKFYTKINKKPFLQEIKIKVKSFILKTIKDFGYKIEKKSKNDAAFLKQRLSKHLSLGYIYENDAFDAIQLISGNTMLTYNRLVSLYEQVIYCEKNYIEGDFVECGAWKGGCVGLMALANLKYGNKRRNLHLFDSFTDICEPDENFDGKDEIMEIKKLLNRADHFTGKLEPLTGIYNQWGGHGTLEDCKKLLENTINYPKDQMFYHVGWFQNTLPVVSSQIASIAILRLDGDWYKSTEICFKYLYDKVVKNGVIIIDDFGYEGCKKATLEFISKNNLNPLINHIDNTCIYWVKTF